VKNSPPYVLKYAALDELQLLAQSAPLDHWLSAAECDVYNQWNDAQRRATWLGGRLLAKQLILDQLFANSNRSVVHHEIEIHTGLPRNRRERPQISIAGRRLSQSLSITHTSRGVMVALATHSSLRVGVDLVEAKIFTPGFIRYWFTEAEQNWILQNGQPDQVAAIWAMKEALYKACNEGEGFSPRSIQVLPSPSGSYSCRYAGKPLRACCQMRSWQIGQQTAALAWVELPRPLQTDCLTASRRRQFFSRQTVAFGLPLNDSLV